MIGDSIYYFLSNYFTFVSRQMESLERPILENV